MNASKVQEVIFVNMQIGTNRIFVVDDCSGELLAEITYPADSDGIVNIDRVFVSPALRGQGMAGKLMEKTLQQLRKTDRKCHVTCSYAAGWMQRHPEWADILVS